jgi:hypothetical protein
MAAQEEYSEKKHHDGERIETGITNNEVKTLLSWKAPGRPFKKRSKQYYLTSLLIAFLIEIILFLFGQYLLMLVVASLIFMAFALASVPPQDFHYKISSEGIMIEEHFYLWKELYDFYFVKHDSEDTLRVGTEDFFPGEITLVLRGIDREHVKAVLLQFLPFREVVKSTFMEKSGDWLEKNFPLEKSPKS